MPITLTKPKAAPAPPPPAPPADAALKTGTVKLTAPKAAGKKAAPAASAAAPAPEPTQAAAAGVEAAGMNLKAVEPVATVEVETKKSGQSLGTTTAQEPVALPDHIAKLVENTPCMVGMTLGYTQGMPDYCSAKATVSLTVPCRHSEIDTVADFVKEWVNDRLALAAQELMQMDADAKAAKAAAHG